MPLSICFLNFLSSSHSKATVDKASLEATISSVCASHGLPSLYDASSSGHQATGSNGSKPPILSSLVFEKIYFLKNKNRSVLHKTKTKTKEFRVQLLRFGFGFNRTISKNKFSKAVKHKSMVSKQVFTSSEAQITNLPPTKIANPQLGSSKSVGRRAQRRQRAPAHWRELPPRLGFSPVEGSRGRGCHW